MIRIEMPITNFTGSGYTTFQTATPIWNGEFRFVLSEDEKSRTVVVFNTTTRALVHERYHHLDCPESGFVRTAHGDYDDWKVVEDFKTARRALGTLADLIVFPQLEGPADDPLNIRYELEEAWADYAAEPTPPAAFAVAAALGKACLFGVALTPDLDGWLFPVLVAGAASHFESVMKDWILDVKKLDIGYGDKWRTEDDEDCISLLERRMDAWGVLVSVSERIVHLGSAKFDVENVKQLVFLFDRWLRTQEEPLSAVVGLPLLSNWKALLVPPYRDQLPWFLDGTLDTVAARIRKEALAAMPDTATWRIIADAARRADKPNE